VAVLAAAVALVPMGAGARPGVVVAPAAAWVTDGDVLAIAAAGGSVYVGGDFGLIGRATGSWAEIRSADPPSARVLPGRIDGDVQAAVGDGRGGWFLLGDIGAVDGVEPRTDIVHLDGAGNLDDG
jgi:hypothetical protein